MGTPFLSELRLLSFNFPPKGWALCNGQLMPINQNQALFSLLGTTYGGDGQTTFALPDLQGQVPIHMGSGFVLGQQGGEYNHTLTSAEMAAHAHLVAASTAPATAPTPTATSLLAAVPSQIYAPPGGGSSTLDAASSSMVGGSQAHDNTQPYLTLTWCIALQGIYPSQN